MDLHWGEARVPGENSLVWHCGHMSCSVAGVRTWVTLVRGFTIRPTRQVAKYFHYIYNKHYPLYTDGEHVDFNFQTVTECKNMLLFVSF